MLLSSAGATPDSPEVIFEGEPVSRFRDAAGFAVILLKVDAEGTSVATRLVASRLEGMVSPEGVLRFTGMVEV